MFQVAARRCVRQLSKVNCQTSNTVLLSHRPYMWSSRLANVTDLSIAKEVSEIEHHEHYSMYGGSDLKADTSCNPSKHVIIDLSHPQAYKRGHIPGARNLPLTSFDFSQSIDKFHITEDEVVRQLAGVGVSDETEDIILYDNSAMLATRLWFVLRYFGFHNTRVFNGGWRAYRDSNLPIETGDPHRKYFHCAFDLSPKANVNDTMIMHAPQVGVQHESGTSTFLDCREPTEFKKFRIPHSINIPVDEFVLKGQFRDVEKMKKKWESSGLHIKRGRVICYSERNISASVAYFALSQLIGSEHVCVFEGGIKAWRQLSAQQLSAEALEHLGMGG